MSDLVRGPGIRYPEVGQCIYCASIDKTLTDEHIFPFALGGNWVLPKSSCRDCAKITLNFEAVTCRTTLGNLRMRYGFPTRRKRDRPTHIEIGTKKSDGSRGRRKIPVTEYPVGAFIPYFGRAGFFRGAPPNLDVLDVIFKNHSSDDLNEFTKKYNWDGIVTVRWMPVEYGLTVIKVAYCYTVAALGIDGFEPICLDYILGKNKNISYIFGQFGENEAVNGPSPVWDVSLQFHQFANGVLLLAHCSIMPGMGTPIYEVIVGYLRTKKHLLRFNKNLENNRIAVIPQSDI